MNHDSVDMTVKVGKLVLRNPVIPAAGTFGYGQEMADFVDFEKLGALTTKAISLEPRLGNPPPRFAETIAGALFSGGSQNVGLDKFISDKLPFYKQFSTPLIVNIRGDSVSEFVQLAERLSQEEGVSGFELVISCPNLEKGVLFSTDPNLTYEVVKAVREVTDLTIIPKLSPDITDITLIAKACVEAGADAITLINSPRAMGIDIYTKKSKIHPNIIVSLTGPCIKPIALRLVYQVVQAVDVPVIGVGGITGPEDALEFLIAGAAAVEIGMFKFIDPCVMDKTIDGIKNYLIETGMHRITDIIGSFSTV
jgi:dihydroorotate dehydrogenase (NAD+) catalytic subunit